MGNLQANVSKQVFSEFTEFISNNATNIVNQNQLQCSAGNTLGFQTGGGGDCEFYATNSRINIGQRATSTCMMSAENINQVQIDIKNNIATTVEQFAQQGSKNAQDWLALAVSFQINDVDNITKLSSLIQNSITTDVQNYCQNQVLATNNGIIHLCGSYDGVTFDVTQDAFATGIASCINKNIIHAFTANDTLRTIVQRTDQQLASQQAGLGSVLFWLAIAGGILLLIIIIVVVVFLVISSRSGGGGGGQQQQSLGFGPVAALRFAQQVPPQALLV